MSDLGLDLARAVELLAMHGIAVADGFTSCWTEKYRTNLPRPVTRLVRPPPRPPSPPSSVPGSPTRPPPATRPVPSPHRGRAAYEAANSRVLGGIHYPMGIAAGLDQRECVAKAVMTRVRTRKGNSLQFP